MEWLNIIKKEVFDCKLEYLSFFILTLISYFFAWMIKISNISYILNKLTNQQILSYKSITNIPLEHFAPNTIAFSLASLFLLGCMHRIIFGVNAKAIQIAKDIIFNPIINFISQLCRAMIGILLGASFWALIFSKNKLLSIFFIVMMIYPIMYIIFSHGTISLIMPVSKFKEENKFWLPRIVGVGMLISIPISIIIVSNVAKVIQVIINAIV